MEKMVIFGEKKWLFFREEQIKVFGIVPDGFLGTDTCKFTYTNLYNKVWNEN